MRRKTIRRIADEVERRMVPVEPPDPATLVRSATALRVSEGDVVVLHAPDNTAPIVAAQLKKAAAEVFVPAKVLVVSESVRLTTAARVGADGRGAETIDYRQEQTMTDEQAADKLRPPATSRDLEAAHFDADRVLCDLLVSLGYTKTVEAWEAVPKWYA